MTCKARKINKLFGYEYDPVTLKKFDGIEGYMVNRVTCSADRISKLTNSQIVEQVKSNEVNSDDDNDSSDPEEQNKDNSSNLDTNQINTSEEVQRVK
jgi:hypothetical protein